MGLDTTHNAWHGPYSSFNEMRREILKAFDGSDLWEYYGYKGKSDAYKGTPLETIEDKGIYLLMNHADCEGEFTPDECRIVADSIETVLPKIKGYYGEKAHQFLIGLRDAASKNESLLFE